MPSASWDSFSSMASPRYLESQGLFHQHQQSVLELFTLFLLHKQPVAIRITLLLNSFVFSAASYGPGRVPGMGGEEGPHGIWR